MQQLKNLGNGILKRLELEFKNLLPGKIHLVTSIYGEKAAMK